ncbi:dynein regulatory complex protein 8 isoform X1 [Myotis myotis]|uniref:dynein regulatory complex protein 8 isoform X1 n=1 Tax=Myotis myotis TaxID=51298 RepID=UPI00174818B1|nr:dynein regulatory complex protein 8 isoform X1 [Myotis myotis]
MADEKEKESAELAVADLQRKVREAFEVFDHELNNTVDVREIGTIIRSLGCCPNEGELHDLIAEVEEEEPTGYIRFEKFLPVMTNILVEKRYRPIPEEILLQAFEVLDPTKRGFLSKEELIKYMTEEATLDETVRNRKESFERLLDGICHWGNCRHCVGQTWLGNIQRCNRYSSKSPLSDLQQFCKATIESALHTLTNHKN